MNAAGWTRGTYTFTAPAGCTQARPYALRVVPTGATTVHLWGAQLETGPVATPYIPTAATTADRVAGAAQGCIIADVTVPAASLGVNRVVWEVSDGTYNERFFLWIPAGAAQFQVLRFAGGSPLFGSPTGTIAADTTVRVGVRWGNGAFDVSVNGGAFVTLAASVPTTNKLQAGNLFDLTSPLGGRLNLWGGRARPSDASFLAATSLATPAASIPALIGG